MVSNIFNFYPYLGKWSNLTNIFQMGWNHQLDINLHFSNGILAGGFLYVPILEWFLIKQKSDGKNRLLYPERLKRLKTPPIQHKNWKHLDAILESDNLHSKHPLQQSTISLITTTFRRSPKWWMAVMEKHGTKQVLSIQATEKLHRHQKSPQLKAIASFKPSLSGSSR